MTSDRRSRAVASLHGLAVGDALGSCFFIPDNQLALDTRELPPDPWWWTDDTEMACSIVITLHECGRIDQDALGASFAEHHDFDRGYGAGVNRMLRLIRQEGGDWRRLAAESWDGRGSRGNGAAMRVAPLGAYFADNPQRAAAEAALSAKVTHTHPEGVAGAVAVAVAAAVAASKPELRGVKFLHAIAEHIPPGLVRDAITNAIRIPTPRRHPTTSGQGRLASGRARREGRACPSRRVH